MKKKVSVIIPFYNAEKYLSDCLNCLFYQTLTDMEVILVNDASTDRGPEIAKSYKERYPDKIVLLDSKVNQGAGGARNLGIAAARGEYIGFVDSDDLIEPTMYEKLYKRACETDADIVDSGYYKQASNSAILHMSDELTGTLDDRKRSMLIAGGGYIVSKLFHRRLFARDGWQFRTNVILEDSDVLTYLYAIASKTANVKEVLYYYREIDTSSSKIVDTKRYYKNICAAIKGIYDKVHVLNNYNGIQDAVEYEMLQMYSYGVNICIRDLIKQTESMENKRRLELIAQLKKSCVTGSYDNPYVQAKIDSLDVELMKSNDLGVDALLQTVRKHVQEEAEL